MLIDTQLKVGDETRYLVGVFMLEINVVRGT